MTDAEFVAALESCTLPSEAFRHRDHLRLAWLYLRQAPYEEAVRTMESGIRRFAAHHGALEKYHHTITLLWMRLVAAAAADEEHATFDSFIAAHRELLDKDLPKSFYSATRLSSMSAREGWVDPDLRPLPEVMPTESASRGGV